jgi:hypothetical protein
MSKCEECLEEDDDLVDGVCGPCREHFENDGAMRGEELRQLEEHESEEE